MPRYINKLNVLDIITAICGMTAATTVALRFPQPYFGIAFWLYVVSAACALYAAKERKSWALMFMFGYYLMIDSYGVYNWWPW